jgi:LPXTG-site transpeptidase (sortase) family protein
MATRDLIPEGEFALADTDEFAIVTTDVEELEQSFVAPAFVPDHDAAVTRELRLVPPVDPAPTVGSAFRLFTSVARARIRDLYPRVDRRHALEMVGQGVSIVGVLLVALALFEGFAGRITEQRDQRKLRGAFEQILEQQGGFAPVAGDGIIPPGTPVASIEIPKIGVRKIVIEGTTSDDLRQGPGHLRSTPLPGQHGNAVIGGRRTTYGGPFRNLDRLASGDEIITTTPFGEFTYRVRDVETLAPGDPDRLGATMTDNLTLTTSDPVYRATRRLVVVARLEGKRSTYTDPLRQTQVPLEEAAFFGDAGKALPAFAWTLGVLISLVGARSLYGRWRRWPAYLLTTPVILAMTFGWLEAMVGLLPSTL